MIKRSQKSINYKEIVLKVVFLSVVVSVSVVAPNALKMFDLFFERGKRKSSDTFRLRKETQKLIRSGFIKIENKKLKLTNKGIFELSKYKDVLVKKPKKWDKNWRVVIFDIPDKKKKSRDLIRLHLKQIGFLQMQKSVWVYPFPCDEIIKLIKNHFGMSVEVVYMIVRKIENDKQLKNYFKIK